MNFIENLFKIPSKNHNNKAITNKRSRFFSPQKCVTYAKSQTYSEDKNWPQISLDTSFYLQKMIQVKLGKTDIVPKSKQDKSHMIYEMCILTSDFQYTLKKRFSLFNEFYYEIKKQISHLNLPFPKKTLLVSGTNIDVVTERYELLNSFIKKIFEEVKNQQNSDLSFKFLGFLEIQEQFERRKLKAYTELPKNSLQKKDSFCVEDTSISFELRKLNDFNNHQKEIISRLQNYISYKNYKITNDQIKTLLTGNSAINLKGLLNLSLSINNQIKSLELLRFLVDYLSPEKKSYHDKIYKQFEKLPLEAFHFNYDQIKNNFTIIQFKKVFFILLELYCHNKLFNQTKILERYPELLVEFELWKSLSEINHGKLTKKVSSVSNQHFDLILRKTSTHPQKARSFQINPKICETHPQNLYPIISADNVENLLEKSILDEKYKKYSFRSNDSTSQLTIEDDWENCKLKLELGQNYEDQINENQYGNMEILQSTNLYYLKSNKRNKISIEILKTTKDFKQCEQISNSWNKLIYDQRHDQFTGISRIYMKLNGKSKIFKFKQEDEKVQKKDEKFLCISKKRLESHNSISKCGKQNLQENLKIKVSSYSNGFEEIHHIENVDTILGQVLKESYRKVTIQFNFEGEQDYFKTQIMGITTCLLQSAINAYLE